MLENNHTIHLTLNGESRAFTVEPQETLLHVLRERAHLTGAKKGCDLGECGACTVIMDGRAVNSCCVFAIEADGSTVETIEGIGTADEPRPLQQAFIDAGVTEAYLWREHERAMRAEVTPDCRQGCQGCGLKRFEGACEGR